VPARVAALGFIESAPTGLVMIVDRVRRFAEVAGDGEGDGRSVDAD
jgi:hypothetical protein